MTLNPIMQAALAPFAPTAEPTPEHHAQADAILQRTRQRRLLTDGQIEGATVMFDVDLDGEKHQVAIKLGADAYGKLTAATFAQAAVVYLSIGIADPGAVRP